MIQNANTLKHCPEVHSCHSPCPFAPETALLQPAVRLKAQRQARAVLPKGTRCGGRCAPTTVLGAQLEVEHVLKAAGDPRPMSVETC